MVNAVFKQAWLRGGLENQRPGAPKHGLGGRDCKKASDRNKSRKMWRCSVTLISLSYSCTQRTLIYLCSFSEWQPNC